MYFDNLGLYGSHGQTNLLTGLPWFWPGFSGTPGDPLGDALAQSATDANGGNGGNGHVFDDYVHRQSQYLGTKGDYTSQVNQYHQLKAGFEADWHKLRLYEHYFPSQYPVDTTDINTYGFANDGKTYVDNGRDGPRKPFTGSFYAQDKYERSGVVVNGGLRWDYIRTDSDALANENLPLGSDGVLNSADLQASKTYSRISPRLGLAFPITERSVMHVNWGQFFQQPNLQDLYVSYRFLDYKIRSGGYYVGFGDPNLKPEQTTAYEVGLAHHSRDLLPPRRHRVLQGREGSRRGDDDHVEPQRLLVVPQSRLRDDQGSRRRLRSETGQSHLGQHRVQPFVRGRHGLRLEYAAQHRVVLHRAAEADLAARLRSAPQGLDQLGLRAVEGRRREGRQAKVRT
jgi:hypothetical protein